MTSSFKSRLGGIPFLGFCVSDSYCGGHRAFAKLATSSVQRRSTQRAPRDRAKQRGQPVGPTAPLSLALLGSLQRVPRLRPPVTAALGSLCRLPWRNLVVKPKRDPDRERRITMEIVVDAYDTHERAMGWYYYLQDQLQFPFTAT